MEFPMKRFFLGVGGLTAGLFLGNITGIVLLWMWANRELTYDTPGGIPLAIAQGVAAIVITQLICSHFGDRTLARTATRVGAITIASLSAVGLLGCVVVGLSMNKWHIFSSIANIAPWFFAMRSVDLWLEL
jgi:hypothetical protein